MGPCCCRLLHSLEGHPHPVHRGRQRPEQSSWAWRSVSPRLGLVSLASVLFLAQSGQIRTGSGLGSRGKGLAARLPTHSFPRPWPPEQAGGRHKGKGGRGQARPHQAGLEGRRGPQQLQRFIHPGMWTDPQIAQGPRYRPWSGRTGWPGTQLPAPRPDLLLQEPCRCGAWLRGREAHSPDGWGGEAVWGDSEHFRGHSASCPIQSRSRVLVPALTDSRASSRRDLSVHTCTMGREGGDLGLAPRSPSRHSGASLDLSLLLPALAPTFAPYAAPNLVRTFP